MTRTGIYAAMHQACAALTLGALPLAAMSADRTIEIEATEFAFEPAKIEVEQGETVRLKLVNNGNLSHNLHLRGADTQTDTIQTGNSDSVEFTATEDGTVHFFCDVPGHEQAGMTGRLKVQ
ncbi:MAG: plastocyanin/azurin family copper-binding protein [Halofilum sp. (in: g-proteobacteria)]|nr:plastocyanin/azurin family copper-binding protein [Halofilum sp. (in: g-proteobacteria)]